jgi:hypothetical protein
MYSDRFGAAREADGVVGSPLACERGADASVVGAGATPFV